MQVIFVSFNVNCGFHAVSVVEQMSVLDGTVFKYQIWTDFRFSGPASN